MIIQALKKHGELTTQELAEIVDKPIQEVEQEIHKLWQQGKVCTKNGVHYLTPKNQFPEILLGAFLISIMFWYGVAAI